MTVLLPQPLGLLDLPDDVLRIVLSRRFLPPTALVEVACVSKAAAAVALPELYSDLLIPSIAALPLIYSTLGTHPELARHVRSLRMSRFLLLSYHMDEYEPKIQKSRPCPDSPIVCMDKVNIRLRRDILDAHLPMPWLVRIAHICPRLTTVDFSNVEELNRSATFLLLGLADLAAILRGRGGRFACRSLPISCILVKDRTVTPFDHPTGSAKFELDVYFIDGVDWGRKRVDVTDYWCCDEMLGTNYCLVPFRELVPLADQADWSIGNAMLRNQGNKHDLMQEERWFVSSWLKSKRDLWLKGGLAHGEDRVFDFSQPALINGTITLGMPTMDLLDDVPTSIRAHMYRQCTELVFEGVDPDSRTDTPLDERQQVVAMTLHIYSTIPDRPLTFVTLLRFISAYFVDETTISHIMHVFAQGVPNLVQLEMYNAVCPIDLMLNHADALIRRSLFPGKLLQALALSSYVPDPTHEILPVASPRGWNLAGTHHPRSPLGASHPKSRLESLELELRGPGVEVMDSFGAATVAIHPDILRELKSLTLLSVQLYHAPPELAQPDSPSFMPLAHLPRSSPVPLTHAFTLPNVTHFDITSNAIKLPTRATPRHLLRGLPHMPALQHVRVAIDRVHDMREHFDLALVPLVLRRFPALVYARFVYLSDHGAGDGEWVRAFEDEFFKPYPRELGACPRLRGVWVNEGAPVEYYSWMERQRRMMG